MRRQACKGHDEIIRSYLPRSAFNRGAFDAAVAVLDPEPLEFPGGGTYHGCEAVKR